MDLAADLNALLLLTGDQPFVTAAVLAQIIQLRLTSGKPIVHPPTPRRSEFPLSLIDPVFQIYCDSKKIAEPKRSFSRGHTMSSPLIFPPARSTSTPLQITKSSINLSQQTARGWDSRTFR
jgi:hypothetical protein